MAACATANEQIILGEADGDPSAFSLNTALVVQRGVSAFASYLRESKSLSGRLLNPLANTTIFAPTDQAIYQLSRKPHEGPERSQVDEMDVEQEKRDAEYLEQWTSQHLVAGNVDLSDLPVEYETIADDRTVRIESQGEAEEAWRAVRLMPGHAKILSRTEASDGVLYVLDSVLDF